MASDITVIVGPSGEAGCQVRSILKRLRGLGVLTDTGSLIWIDDSNDRWIMRDSAGWQATTNLQDDLALLRCESAMFITTELSLAALQTFGTAFDPSVAIAATNELKFPPGMVASRFRLVVPVTHEDSFDPMLMPGWSTVVAAPENRFSDRHPPAALKVEVDAEPGDYFGHVAAHVATLAGMWRNDTDDLFGEQSAAVSEGSAIAQRVFSRSVVGLDVSTEIVEPLLDQQPEGWPVPRGADGGIDIVPHPLPHELISAAIERLGTVDGFRYKRPANYTPPTAGRISMADAFRLFLARIRLAVVDVPAVFSSHAKQQLEASAQRLTAAITGLGGDGSSVTFTGEAVAAGDFGSAADMLERVGAPVFVQATPGAWRTLRSICFGLIDGDRSSAADAVATVEGRRTVITNPSLIAPPPDSSLLPRDIDDFEEIAPSDARAFRDAIRTPGESGPSSNTLTSWKTDEQRAQSLLWQLGSGIAAEQERAAVDVAEALDALAEVKDENGHGATALQRLERLRTTAWIVGAVMLSALVYAVLATASDLRDGSFFVAKSLDAMTTATWVTLAALIGFVLTAMWYIREELRIRHQFDDRYRRIEWAQDTLPKALKELHRLEVTYEQFLDWAAIISHIVHRPWGVATQDQTVTVRETFGGSELPHSVLVVYGGSDSSAESHVRQGLEAELAKVGWLGRIYAETSTQALEDFARERRRVNDERLDPDEDVPTSPNGTRSWLAQQYVSGQGQELARRRARGLAVSYLLKLDPSETLPRLDHGWHPQTLLEGLSTTELLSELAEAGQVPFDQSIFTPGGQQRGAREVLVRSSFMPDPLRPDGSHTNTYGGSADFTLVSTRVELSGPTPMSDFTVFERTGGGDEIPIPMPSTISPPEAPEDPLI